jgi:hypothetical protein
MADESLESRMSELADGELSNDPANELLLEVLDDRRAREQLRRFLRLRLAFKNFRQRRRCRNWRAGRADPGGGPSQCESR